VKPNAVASSGVGGVASVSGGPWDSWRIVVTTKPSGLPVLVKIRGQKKVIASSPIVRRANCRPRCTVRVTAQLSATSGKTPQAATVSLALYGQ
jgi:hypothetical protein